MRKSDITDLKIAKSLRRKARKLDEQFRCNAENHERKKEHLLEQEEEFWDFVSSALATASEIEAFTYRLDQYDEATIKALQENQLQLDEVRERLEGILGNAYVHEDGRRVFKTRDGQRVFDEYGQQLSPEEISPDEIPDIHPYWEVFKAEKDSEDKLIQEREKILEYQKKLDDAREHLDDEDLTKKELDDFGKDLEASMPISVRKQVMDLDTMRSASTAPDLKQPFNQQSAILKSGAKEQLVITGPEQGL